MKKVFSLWFMDIAKYIVTALVLSTVLTDVADVISRWIFYSAAFILIAIIILCGVVLFRSADKDEKKEKQDKEKDKKNKKNVK